MKAGAGVSLVIVAIGTAAVLALAGLSEAQEAPEARPRAITECKEQLPENKQYTLNIDIYIDTRQGEENTLDLILLDDAAPDSVDIPEGTEAFIDCVLRTLGLPEEQI